MIEYPEWCKKQCPHCAAGMGMSAQTGVHWTGSANPPVCQAMYPDAYIAALEAELAGAKEKIEELYSSDLHSAHAMAEIMAERNGLREQLEAARKALEAQDAFSRNHPTPWGHECRWCYACVKRVEEMRTAALAPAPPEEDADAS